MTTQEMIEILQAYDRGEEIESGDKIRDFWVDLTSPSWNFNKFDYRIKPKEEKRKFKVGDRLIRKKAENSLVYGEADIVEVTALTENGYTLDTEGTLPFDKEDTQVKVDDCLWYWEIFTEDDIWTIDTDRKTKAEIMNYNRGFTLNRFIPLYALGFKLPKEMK